MNRTGKPRPEICETPLSGCDSSQGGVKVDGSVTQKHAKVGRFGHQGQAPEFLWQDQQRAIRLSMDPTL